MDQEKLSSISVKRKKVIFEIESKDKKLLLKNNPDLKIDEEKLKQVAEVIDAFYFYDVRKVNKIKKNNNNTISYEFKDGLILELKFIEKSKDSKESWIEISAKSNDPKTINEANNLNKKYGSLSQGQENIVSLGVGSSYLAWLGIAMLTQYDYRDRSARYIDVASLTAGWYFSRKNVGSDFSIRENGVERKNDLALKINPIMINQNKKLIPGVSVNLIF